MTADRIADALDLLARAVETHDGAPADTNLARAQVLATIAVAEQLAKLTQAVAAQHGPPAPATHTTGGQAETAPEQPGEPVLTLSDRWKDRDGESWRVVTNAAGELRLTLSGHLCTWGEVDGAYGLTLIERAGYRRTTDTAPINTVTRFRVVSCEEWEDGAPVEIDTVHAVGVTYWVLGEDGRDSITVPAAPDMRVTLWDEIAGGAR